MIETRTSKWYEVKIAIERTMEDGSTKTVKEVYTVDALSFTEAETVITEHASGQTVGEFDILEEKIAKYKEVVFSTDNNELHWWKVKVNYITFDEKAGKEKKMPVLYLVEAESNEKAFQTMKSVMDKGVIEYQIVDVVSTPIIEVIMHGTLE